MHTSMKTIILCGGIGYRLREETEFKPKPMVTIGSKPILWHIMKIYAQFGFREFIIALGYKGDMIKDYFLNQKYFAQDFSLHTKSGKTIFYKDKKRKTIADNFVITFVDTGQETFPGERILSCEKYIPKRDKHFMVTYGDGVGDINISKLVEFHCKRKTIGTITGVHPRGKYGLINVDRNKTVFHFSEKPVLSDWVNGGFMVFQRSFFSLLRSGETEHPALMRLSQKKQLSLYIHDGFWHSMDTYTDVEHLNKLWKENPKWKLWKD